MKTYYIYLVTINHPKGPYYYVGQHGWNGEGLDPKYHGSCMYQSSGEEVKWDKSSCSRWYAESCKKYGFDVKVLSWCNKYNVSKEEEKWIDLILTLVGSKLKDESVSAKPFLSKYKSGTCLNGRITGTDALQTESSRRKAIETRLNNGSLARAQQLATEAARSPEAREKQRLSRQAIATRVRVWYDGEYKGELNNPQIRDLLGATKGQVSTLMHRAKVKRVRIYSERWNVHVESIFSR